MESYRQNTSAIKILLFSVALLFPWRGASGQLLNTITPEALVVQYAGSTGFATVSAGYTLFKGKGNFDLGYGFIPRSKGGRLHIASGKFAFRPFTFHPAKNVVLYPANPGAFLTYNFGKAFSFEWEKPQYEKGYYFWSQSLRSHLSLSNEIRIVPNHKIAGAKEIGIYNEFNTNDLYVISWWQNKKTVSFSDIVRIGIGTRIYF